MGEEQATETAAELIRNAHNLIVGQRNRFTITSPKGVVIFDGFAVECSVTNTTQPSDLAAYEVRLRIVGDDRPIVSKKGPDNGD